MDAVRRMLQDAVGRVFPAAQLLVADQGELRLDEAAGPCDRDTLFDVASLTKALVTTTLTMRALDAGRLSLDDELRPGVTIFHALCHASGLPAWRPLHELAGDADDLRAAVVERARREPLEAAPGARSVYSDLGFILLGDRLEQLAGAPLDEQFAPIAARFAPGCGFDPDPERCAPARPDDGGGELDLRGTVHDDNALAMGGVAGHAGLFASARHVGQLAEALVAAWCARDGGDPIARPETVRRFWSPCGVPGSTWCLGWDRPSPGASQAGARFSRDGVGHLGFTGCSLWIDPPRTRWVVLVSNRVYDPACGEAIKQFRPALHDAILAALDGA